MLWPGVASYKLGHSKQSSITASISSQLNKRKKILSLSHHQIYTPSAAE
jgi:hypothetical protein